MTDKEYLESKVGKNPTIEQVEIAFKDDHELMAAFKREVLRCKDPVYMYENYWTIEHKGKRISPKPLDEMEKKLMRGQIGELEFFRYWIRRRK